MNRITISFDMKRITIAIVIGISLVMGALMYGATKPLANQAFAATPCSLTVGTPPGVAVPGSIIGKLICGGQGLGLATIHLTLHGITTGSLNKADVLTKSGGDFDRTVRLVPGHSYTVDVKYDGDSNNQPASATTTIDLTGSTGSTQGSNNAGNSQQNNSTQASAATPCNLTVGTPPNENPPGSLIGKLICGGQGINDATIKFSGLPGGSSESTLTDHGRYEQGIFTQLNPGQSYTITAHFDGDSNQHLQPASATTTINVKGSTGNTPDNTNAGNTPDNTNAGNTPDNTNAQS